MELFEQIHQEYEFGVGMIAGEARKLGVHRRMVREALGSAEPTAPKPRQRRLRAGRSHRFHRSDTSNGYGRAPKQRHTARSIFDRLGNEHPGFSGRSAPCGYVQGRRQ